MAQAVPHLPITRNKGWDRQKRFHSKIGGRYRGHAAPPHMWLFPPYVAGTDSFRKITRCWTPRGSAFCTDSHHAVLDDDGGGFVPLNACITGVHNWVRVIYQKKKKLGACETSCVRFTHTLKPKSSKLLSLTRVHDSQLGNTLIVDLSRRFTSRVENILPSFYKWKEKSVS